MKQLALILSLVPALFACSGDEPTQSAPDTRRAVAQLDEHLTLGEPVTEGNLTVWPVFTDNPLDLGEFLTLQEALTKSVAEVREVGGDNSNDVQQEGQVIQTEAQQLEDANEPDNDEPIQGPSQNASISLANGSGGATVNTLVIENKGDVPILICAGTIVKGGNQDRQIGQDFVVQANTTVPVDAFCVEQGRWSGERQGLATAGKFEVASTNATLGVRTKGQYGKDQNEVWQEVDKVKKQVIKQVGVSEDSETPLFLSSSYAVALDANDKASAQDLETVCATVKKHFAGFGNGKTAPVGFAYAINGKPVNVRTFAHARVFAKQFGTFVNTMATEALLDKQEKFDAPTAEAIVKLIDEVRTAEENVAQTAALNRNGIRESALAYHNSCYVPARDGKEQAVLTKDWTAR